MQSLLDPLNQKPRSTFKAASTTPTTGLHRTKGLSATTHLLYVSRTPGLLGEVCAPVSFALLAPLKRRSALYIKKSIHNTPSLLFKVLTAFCLSIVLFSVFVHANALTHASIIKC